MSVFGKLFGKSGESDKTLVLSAPLGGRLLPLSEVPDDIFAGKVLGDGFAIEPNEGLVVAPFDCQVAQVFRTGHAIGLTGPGGLEVLVHVGIDTVKLAGVGFKPRVSEGQKLRTGDVMLEFDLEHVRANAKSTVTPIVITNRDAVGSLELLGSGTVKRGDPVLRVLRKS
ncbi:MAG: PTS glucose transporter subunit IIA [Bdellovibrionota bacterium]